MKELRELKEKIESIEITYNYEESYNNLYNTVIDYMNEYQDFSLEYLFEDFITYDIAEEIAKNELENGGLIRLYYFMGDANPNNNDLFKINGYGKLVDITKEDLEDLKDNIISNIEDKL